MTLRSRERAIERGTFPSPTSAFLHLLAGDPSDPSRDRLFVRPCVAARVLHALKSAAAARISPYSWMRALSALLGPTQPPGRRSAARAAVLLLALSRVSLPSRRPRRSLA